MPHLPPISPDRMGELKTLGQICDHLGSQAAQPAEDLAATSPPESATEETGRVPTAVIRQDLLFEEAPFARGEKAQYPENTTLYIVGQGTGARTAAGGWPDGNGRAYGPNSCAHRDLCRSRDRAEPLLRPGDCSRPNRQLSRQTIAIPATTTGSCCRRSSQPAGLPTTSKLPLTAEAAILATVTFMDGRFGPGRREDRCPHNRWPCRPCEDGRYRMAGSGLPCLRLCAGLVRSRRTWSSA
jgi:hypothetical protein